MSYSRWGNSNWYTYWAFKDLPPGSKDKEEMYIHYDLHIFTRVTYGEIKKNKEDILFTIGIDTGATADELEELSGYMNMFLFDVDLEYEREDY